MSHPAPALDWNAPHQTWRVGILRALAPFVVYVLVAGGAIVIWNPSFGVPLIILLALPLLLPAYSYRRGHARALKRIGAVRVQAGHEPRLARLARGLAGDLRLGDPALFVVPEGGPNAAVCWVDGGPGVAVTRSLLDSFTLTELEAVLAHCLVRAAAPRFRAARLAMLLGPFGWLVGRVVTHADDVRTCALTRYPPGLLRALDKCELQAASGPLWFFGRGPFHEPVEERRAVLFDL